MDDYSGLIKEITAIAKQRDAAEGKAVEWNKLAVERMTRIRKLEAENAKFREALKYIADHSWAKGDKWLNEFVDIAQKAIGQES